VNSLHDIAVELEKAANLHNVDLFIDEQYQDNFIHIVSSKGIVGAVGIYSDGNTDNIGYFILNSKVLTYALKEGFNVDDIYSCFKKSIFTEMSKDEFIDCIVGAKI